MDLQIIREKASAICQKYGLDAEAYELVGSGGQILIEIIDPNESGGSILSSSQEHFQQIVVELKNEFPGCLTVGRIS